MNNIVNFESITVRTDEEGRYCLNDIQKAVTVGMNPRTVEVYEYLRRPETIELIAEIENTGNSKIKAVVSHRGRNGGTYVVKELVYSYAMWISPAFHLKVIQTFRRLNEQGVAIADHAVQDVLNDPLEYFGRLLDQAKEIQARRTLAQSNIHMLHSAREVKGEKLARIVRRLPAED